MPARHLIVGFDGADLDVIRQLGPERLPVVHGLMAEGAYAHQRSVMPPATLPNWTTFLTALDPGRHGVFDFTTREGYAVRFTAGTAREAPTIFARLDRLGMRCACVGFPATWPPERLEHGVFVSGWDAPVAFEADRSFVWPPALHDAIERRFGTTRFDDVDEFDVERPGWHDALPAALRRRIERKVSLASWLLERDWDCFAIYFGESDTASHHLWALHDPESPRNPGRTTDGLAEVYVALDEALGALRAAASEVELTVVSDHGSGGSSDLVLHLNRALADAGLLRFRDRGTRWPGRVKDAALTLLPPKAREAIFRLGGAALPSWLESRARFGAIDMRRTIAFSDELNYFPGVWLNVRGREPDGGVEPADYDATCREVERALMALRDPEGRPVVSRVWRRDELYAGPYVERAPDLLLRLNLAEGYSYNLMPSLGATSTWRRLGPDEYLGRKGRSLAGSHRERGFFLAHGAKVAAAGEVDASIADAVATALARMDVAPPVDAAGRILYEILEDFGGEARPLPEAEARRGRGDEAAVERRLRALGYID